MKKVLTIAGSDSCGGAGVQADLKAMSALGVYGMSVITAITAQNTQGVFGVQEISSELITGQIEAIFSDIQVDAVKIGMLSSSEIIKTVSKNLQRYKPKNVVIDPVMVSKSNYKLLKDEAIDELKSFISLGEIITPNIPEAEILGNSKIQNEDDMIFTCKKIQKLGAKNVLIKGGHRDDGSCTDILLLQNGKIVRLKGERIETKNTHGTGCTLSSAIASFLALGFDVEKSVKEAKNYITTAIQNSFAIGGGVGVLGHLVELYEKAELKYEKD